MSPQGALVAVGLALVAAGVALLIRAETRSPGTTPRRSHDTSSPVPVDVHSVSPSTARLRRASVTLVVAGSGLLLAIAGAFFLWWFTIGTHAF